ncbi:MAG: hypothetical protein NC078_11275 [Ruminococcus sp.]|nr:hypothetical protein [Ruminococcus sp.]
MELTEINREEAFRYMGIRGDVPENIREIAAECEELLVKAASPKFHWVYADISGNSGNEVTLAGYRLVMRGADICGHLEGCCGAALMCASLGEGVDRLLRKLQAEDMAKALAADALASAAVEQVCEYAEREIRERFEGEYFTWRFSPGYGDFPIECQGEFLEAVNAMRTVGVCVTEGGLLTPTKSVTAVMGVSHEAVPPKNRGCGSCNMRDKCGYRERGEHCG